MHRFEKESSNLPPPEIMSSGEDPLFLFSANDLASWQKLPNPLVDFLVGDPENFQTSFDRVRPIQFTHGSI